ncbi:BapA prefix-like domain-containing protein, partial [Pseudogemmobacter faecipullorum]
MGPIRITADKPSDFRITANADQVKQFGRVDNNLIVHLVDGQQIIITDFFVTGPNGEVSRLLYADGSFSGVDSNSTSVEGEGV